MTERELSRTRRNIRVPRGEFGALWQAAEELTSANGERGIADGVPPAWR
ncbi:hypothetical protein [Rhodococcus koreensis]|nr:hypothetical protein [Rhodococcus koreensis]QSE86769.1 hypothetical protein JWS14_47860 [Rhodococcus koreensis]